jgi:hypothetical protein
MGTVPDIYNGKNAPQEEYFENNGPDVSDTGYYMTQIIACAIVIFILVIYWISMYVAFNKYV